jgi:hypothetical protein
MKKSYKIAGIALSSIIASCGSDLEVSPKSSVESNQTQPDNFTSGYQNSDGLLNILAESDSINDKLGFESLLGVKSSRTVDLIPLEKSVNIITGNTIENREDPKVEIVQNLEVEKALKNLEDSALEHQKSIEELRKINLTKDQTISTLSKLNDELISEIKRLNTVKSEYSRNKLLGNSASETSLGSLKIEVNKLKNSLILKSQELENLRLRNDTLEGKIVGMESEPYSTNSNRFETESLRSNFVETPIFDPTESNQRGSNLYFEAVVTALNGKSKEAFYTEFFVLDRDLETILRKAGIKLEEFSSINTYSELWARSRKNAFLFPGVQKTIRTALLSLVERGDGRRVRTDVDGAAEIIGLEKGRYYVIGTASLGKVGVTWSVPISLKSGSNKISLTLANCSWSM